MVFYIEYTCSCVLLNQNLITKCMYYTNYNFVADCVVLIGMTPLKTNNLTAPPPKTYNPAIYENLNIPEFNPNAISFVNYNPMKGQNLEPFSIGFQAITTKAPEYIKIKNLDYSGGGRMTFDMKMVTPTPLDMNNVKFDPNNGNFMKDFDPNTSSFSNKGKVLLFKKCISSSLVRELKTVVPKMH